MLRNRTQIRLKLAGGILCLFVGCLEGGVLMVFAGRVEAQADTSSGLFGQRDREKGRARSIYFSLSIGNSWPLHPGDFHAVDWQNGFELSVAGAFWLNETRNVYVEAEHVSLSTKTVAENPEIRTWRFVGGVLFGHPGRFVTPYVSVDAGVVRQGLRRMFVGDDGSFGYTLAFQDFQWTTGPTASLAVGATIDVSSVVYPYGELSYIGTRAEGVTIGRLTARAGIALSPAKFVESVTEGVRNLAGHD